MNCLDMFWIMFLSLAIACIIEMIAMRTRKQAIKELIEFTRQLVADWELTPQHTLGSYGISFPEARANLKKLKVEIHPNGQH